MGLSAVASSLAQCGVGWVGAVGQAPRWPSLPQCGSFMSLAAAGLEQRLIPPHTLSSPFPSGGHLVPRWNLSHCLRPPHKSGCKLGCSLSGRKNSLSLEPPCFRLSPLPKAKPTHHLQGLNFAERFPGWGLAGKGVGRALRWQRGALGCLGSSKPWFGSAPQCLPRIREGFLHV